MQNHVVSGSSAFFVQLSLAADACAVIRKVFQLFRKCCWMLGDGERLSMDTEDMTLALRLFEMLPAGEACGWPCRSASWVRNSEELVRGGLRTILMVCALDIAQAVAGRITFVIISLDPTTELLPRGPVPKDDITAVCVDGMDKSSGMPF